MKNFKNFKRGTMYSVQCTRNFKWPSIDWVACTMYISQRCPQNLYLIKFSLCHCKLTRMRGSNSIDISNTTLWPRCSSMSDFSHKSKKSKLIQLYLKNSKRFCSSQYFFNKKSYDIKQIKFQCYFYFTLVWRDVSMF